MSTETKEVIAVVVACILTASSVIVFLDYFDVFEGIKGIMFGVSFHLSW